MKRVVNILRAELGLACLWAAVLVLLFETEVLPAGLFAGDGMAEYCLNMAGVVMMIVSLPFSLKLMSFRRVKEMFRDASGDDGVFRVYRRWSEVRLALLSVAMWGNICIYYLTQTNTGCMCALIAVLGLCFCFPFPSTDKLIYETGYRQAGHEDAVDKKKEE